MALQPGLCILALLYAPGADEQFRVSLGLGCFYRRPAASLSSLSFTFSAISRLRNRQGIGAADRFSPKPPGLLCKRVDERVFFIADLDEVRASFSQRDAL